jgi:hypothetical protein
MADMLLGANAQILAEIRIPVKRNCDWLGPPSFLQFDKFELMPRMQPLPARTREVSGPETFRNQMRIRPAFQWFLQNDVCEFESYMPWPPRCDFRLCENADIPTR